ncbi:hypothetical protein Q670_14175 [Alcanivorax sp. P2S70]|nr:hypothetical protein Q670_14175 [Alcanivorax sp. P2S70]
MPYQTDERLKSYLDTNQLHREQLCRAILAVDKRFSDVRPRHPRGGPDGGRDIEALFRDESLAYGAVGFVNQANDSKEQKKTINEKFASDLDSAIGANKKPSVFVFFTNINLTIGEKDTLVESAKKQGITHCEILDRERLRITLDSPDGFSLRFQYLNITLSEEEQASFFARWGDDIQSVISTGFQRIEGTLNRLLFLQESTDPLNHLTFSFELKEKYSADDIGHFRLFCSMHLKEPKQKILGIIFGSSDKSNRMRNDTGCDFTEQLSGIKYGIAGGQWESYLDIESDSETEIDDEEDERYKQVGSSSSIGRSEVEFLPISYSKNSFIRYFPTICLKDLDDAMFLPIANKSLAEKVKAIHIYSNGYKIQEIGSEDFKVDVEAFQPAIPVEFTSQELEDPWVRIRPSEMSSAFHIRFFEKTPKRMFVPDQVQNSLEGRGKNA